MKHQSHNQSLRLQSLDTFRGLTIAAMILVNVADLVMFINDLRF